jgi:hypothetical protein
MLVVEPKAQRSESAPGYAIGHASSSTGPILLVKAWGVALLLYAMFERVNRSKASPVSRSLPLPTGVVIDRTGALIADTLAGAVGRSLGDLAALASRERLDV